LTTKAAMPHLIASGQGTVVNLGGQTAHLPVPERAHVIAGKAGLAAFTKAVALEFADKGVTVNCIAPSLIETVRGLPGAPPRPAGRAHGHGGLRGGDGPLPRRASRPLHHGPDDPRQRRRVHAVRGWCLAPRAERVASGGRS